MFAKSQYPNVNSDIYCVLWTLHHFPIIATPNKLSKKTALFRESPGFAQGGLKFMLGSLRWDKNVAQLRPFALKLRDSFLIGMTPEPEQGSPCVHCVELWLASRRVWSERLNVQELPIRKDLLAILQKENHPLLVCNLYIKPRRVLLILYLFLCPTLFM